MKETCFCASVICFGGALASPHSKYQQHAMWALFGLQTTTGPLLRGLVVACAHALGGRTLGQHKRQIECNNRGRNAAGGEYYEL